MTFKTLVEEERKLLDKLLDVGEAFKHIIEQKGVKYEIPKKKSFHPAKISELKNHGEGRIFFRSDSNIINYIGNWVEGKKEDGKFTLTDGSTCEVGWQNGEKIDSAIFTKDGDEFHITHVGDTITVQYGSHILYIGDKSYRFGHMNNQGELSGLVKEVMESNGKSQECIYFYQNGERKGDQIYDENGNLTDDWKLIGNTLATYSKDGEKATLY